MADRLRKQTLRYTDNLVYAEVNQRERIFALWVAGIAVLFTIACVPIARVGGGQVIAVVPTVYGVATFA